MLAKSIAIIYLLTKGLTPTIISDYLKVSRATIAKFSLLFYQKETKSIQMLKSMITKGKVLGFIEDMFSELYIQPGLKIGHHQLKYEHKKRKFERITLDI